MPKKAHTPIRDARQQRVPVPRRPMLAKVQIARKELFGGDEDSYRAALQRVLGRPSSAQASDAELERVLVEFKRLGWVPKRRGPPLSDKPYVRMVYAIWKDMGPMLACGGSREGLRSYVQRQTLVSAPEFLDGEQAALVIEGLKAWRSRLQKARSAPAG